jgi:glycine/D-amino acid oxidase-like deaminating enzyme
MTMKPRAYLVGGGIGSLAAAAFMIRNGGVPGGNISILEAAPLMGGSLDGTGNPGGGLLPTRVAGDYSSCSEDVLTHRSRRNRGFRLERPCNARAAVISGQNARSKHNGERVIRSCHRERRARDPGRAARLSNSL